jgi:hypothetical protein
MADLPDLADLLQGAALADLEDGQVDDLLADLEVGEGVGNGNVGHAEDLAGGQAAVPGQQAPQEEQMILDLNVQADGEGVGADAPDPVNAGIAADAHGHDAVPVSLNVLNARAMRAAEFDGMNMDPDQYFPGMRPDGTHWIVNAPGAATQRQKERIRNLDLFKCKAALENESARAKKVGMLLMQRICFEMFDKQQVRNGLVLASSAAVSEPVTQKPTEASVMASVRAHLPTFSGIPKGADPLGAVMAIYAWVASARDAAELQLPNAPDARRVQWATCAFKEGVAQWFVAERKRAQIVGEPIDTFPKLQKAMLDYFIEGQVNDLVIEDFTSKHLRDFRNFSDYHHWFLACTDLIQSTASAVGAWSDEVLVQLACKHLKNTPYHENVHELDGVRCTSLAEFVRRLNARDQVLRGRGRAWSNNPNAHGSRVQGKAQLQGRKAEVEASFAALEAAKRSMKISNGAGPGPGGLAKGKRRAEGEMPREGKRGVKCFACGQFGHVKKDCPQRRREDLMQE